MIVFSEDIMKRELFDQQKFSVIAESRRKKIYFGSLLKCSNPQMQAGNKTNYIYSLQLKKCFHQSDEDFRSIWILICIFKTYSKMHS